VHDHIHFAFIGANGDSPNQSAVKIHRLEKILNIDRSFSGADEVSGLNMEGFFKFGHWLKRWCLKYTAALLH
jgi:hypothetical protein